MKLNKLIMAAGSLAAITAPIVTVVACGSKTEKTAPVKQPTQSKLITGGDKKIYGLPTDEILKTSQNEFENKKTYGLPTDKILKTSQNEFENKKHTDIWIEDESSLIRGEFIQSDADSADADKNRKMNVFALGDSVTTGHSATTYVDSNGAPITNQVDLSFTDYIAESLKRAGRLDNYNKVASDSQTTADILSSLDDEKIIKDIQDSDLVTLTGGENDLLSVIKLFGNSYEDVQSVLDGDLTKLVSTDLAQMIIGMGLVDAADGDNENTFNRGTFYYSLIHALKGDSSKVLSLDFAKAQNVLKEMISNIQATIEKVHEINPKAHIIFNGFEFPFSKWSMNGDNPANSQEEAALYQELGFNSNSLKETFDNVQNQIGEFIGGLHYATFYNFNESSVINDDNKSFVQKGLADTNITEYAHALLGQDIYNKVLAPLLFSENITDHEYDSEFLDAKTKVETGIAPVTGNLVFKNLLLENTTNKNWVDGLNDIIQSLIKEVPAASMLVTPIISSHSLLTMTPVFESVFGMNETDILGVASGEDQTRVLTDEQKADKERVQFIENLDIMEQIISDKVKDINTTLQTPLPGVTALDSFDKFLSNMNNNTHDWMINTFDYFHFDMNASEETMTKLENAFLKMAQWDYLYGIHGLGLNVGTADDGWGTPQGLGLKVARAYMPELLDSQLPSLPKDVGYTDAQIQAREDQRAAAFKAVAKSFDDGVNALMAEVAPESLEGNLEWTELYLDVLDWAHEEGKI